MRPQVGVDGGIRADIGEVDRPRKDRFHRAGAGVVDEPLYFHVGAESFFKPSLARSAEAVGDDPLRVGYVRKMADTQDHFFCANGSAQAQTQRQHQRRFHNILPL